MIQRKTFLAKAGVWRLSGRCPRWSIGMSCGRCPPATGGTPTHRRRANLLRANLLTLLLSHVLAWPLSRLPSAAAFPRVGAHRRDISLEEMGAEIGAGGLDRSVEISLEEIGAPGLTSHGRVSHGRAASYAMPSGGMMRTLCCMRSTVRSIRGRRYDAASHKEVTVEEDFSRGRSSSLCTVHPTSNLHISCAYSFSMVPT